MGFWHTGYMEFHEPVGLDDFPFEPSPAAFACAHCKQNFTSVDELRRHRFESHPLRRPTLFLQGKELGTTPVRITRSVTEGDVNADGCDRAFLNGNEVSVEAIPHTLAQLSRGDHRVVLTKIGVSSEFTLEFCIASEEDLRGVESRFSVTVQERRLDVRAIDAFISSSKRFRSAIGYCDGICLYLYGVLAKERTPDSSLPYEVYVRKFNRAARELLDYERPLGRTIGSLIEFHLNHFTDAAKLAYKARVGRAAARYATWMREGMPRPENGWTSSVEDDDLEMLVTDFETEQIIRWAVKPLDYLSNHIEEMESFLKRDIEEYDRVKVQILLAETYAKSGDVRKALQHAKALRNLSALERWAESKISVLRGAQ